jgi:hypothetical protein
MIKMAISVYMRMCAWFAHWKADKTQHDNHNGVFEEMGKR